MSLRNTFILGATILLFSVSVVQSSEAIAQARTLRESLIGTWVINSVKNQYDDGKAISPFGAGVTGRYVFGADGSFSETIIGEARADMKSDDPRRPDAFVVINFGHFIVDEERKSISYKIERAGYSARNGNERSLIATVDGDNATFVTAKIKDQLGTFSFRADVTRLK
jgi:hypothetical protein